MNIGNQIKALRLRRGVTQENMAAHFGITAQAVSKWECGASVPDIGMLPGLSAYFGVSIDELFALSDDVRMERIQNMLWDVRFLNPADVENEKVFLQEKTKREPKSSKPLDMLANLELHLAQEHMERAAEYALSAMEREPNSGRALTALSHAMQGSHVDPRNNYRNSLISHYRQHLKKYPDAKNTYPWLIEQLLADKRMEDAADYVEQYGRLCSDYRLAIARGDTSCAETLWEQMGAAHPNNWSVWHWIGDFQTRVGAYAAAKESYRKSIAVMPAPHYMDPYDSLALTCEMDHDFSGAIAARREELRVAAEEWGDLDGESVNAIQREIERLEAIV